MRAVYYTKPQRLPNPRPKDNKDHAHPHMPTLVHQCVVLVIQSWPRSLGPRCLAIRMGGYPWQPKSKMRRARSSIGCKQNVSLTLMMLTTHGVMRTSKAQRAANLRRRFWKARRGGRNKAHGTERSGAEPFRCILDLLVEASVAQ